jgi:hypothetical protein
MLREAELPGAFRTRGKPNWVVTTLSGEIKEVFFGPKKIRTVRIHEGFLYRAETNESGETFFVGYSLENIKDTDY